MAWSSWIDCANVHVNSFGSSSRFYLLTQYRYNRTSNTSVSYEIKLTLRYRNTASKGGSGTYNYALGVKMKWNGGSDPGYSQVSSGGTWKTTSSTAYATVGSHTYSKTLSNSTGTGTVPISVYTNRTSSNTFDNPGWYNYNLTIPPLTTVTIGFNDNGGSGGPGNQTKTIGTALTVPFKSPIKSSTVINGYTITFSDSIGTPDYSTYSTGGAIDYNFLYWNTASDGTGTKYMPGDSYTGDTAATLYAIYGGTKGPSGKVPLPQSISTTHLLKGWARGSASGTMVDNWYTPTQNETLYAVWEERKGKVRYKDSSNWLPGVSKIQDGDDWVPTWRMESDWTPSSFTVEGTTYTMPLSCTWGYWLSSQYNTDNYYADLINGAWRIVVEEDISSSAFVLANISFETVEDLWATNITANSSYTVQKVYYYTRLEYIESTGTQYIDLGYNHNNTTTSYEMDCIVTQAPNSYHTFFGSRTAYANVDEVYLGFTGARATYWALGTVVRSGVGWTPELGKRYLIHFHPSTGLTINNSMNFPATNGTSTLSSLSDYLGALNQNGSMIEQGYFKIYGFRIYENNVLVMDMVPCYRSSSVGMYDKINKIFYDNSGSGTYIKGPELDW